MQKSKGTINKTKINTYLAPDGKYYDPNRLESYFVTKTYTFIELAQIEIEAGYAALAKSIQDELIFGSKK